MSPLTSLKSDGAEETAPAEIEAQVAEEPASGEVEAAAQPVRGSRGRNRFRPRRRFPGGRRGGGRSGGPGRRRGSAWRVRCKPKQAADAEKGRGPRRPIPRPLDGAATTEAEPVPDEATPGDGGGRLGRHDAGDGGNPLPGRRDAAGVEAEVAEEAVQEDTEAATEAAKPPGGRRSRRSGGRGRSRGRRNGGRDRGVRPHLRRGISSSRRRKNPPRRRRMTRHPVRPGRRGRPGRPHPQ